MKNMKKIKTFENYVLSDKDRLIDVIKKHITKSVPLQPGFRDDGEIKFIEISRYKESDRHTKCECIAMLNKNSVLVQSYYINYEDDGKLYYDEESTPYKLRYEDLDVEVLEKIVDLIYHGGHFYDRNSL